MKRVAARFTRSLSALGAVAILAAAPAVARAAEGPPERAGVQIPAEIPVRRGHEARDVGPGRARAVVVTVVLSAVLLVGVAAVRRRQGSLRGSARAGAWGRWLGVGEVGVPVRCVHSLRLTPRTSVHVLRWSGREWLVGCGDGALTVIGERPVAAAVDTPTDAPPAGATS